MQEQFEVNSYDQKRESEAVKAVAIRGLLKNTRQGCVNPYEAY
jgi:hypothetical protein